MSILDSLNFDAGSVEPNTQPEPLPPGDYLCIVSKVEEKQTKDFTGTYLAIELLVLDGQFRTRLIWDNLNIVNKSAQAQQIGRAQLSGFCRATGVMKPKNVAEFIQTQVLVSVAIKKDGTYGDKNVVKKYNSVAQTAKSPLIPSATGASTTPF